MDESKNFVQASKRRSKAERIRPLSTVSGKRKFKKKSKFIYFKSPLERELEREDSKSP
jgi:hypothetical protein